jgi:adenylyl-sulfate kinase
VTENILCQQGKVGYDERCKLLKQKGCVLWFTGLSGAGKSSLSAELEYRLIKLNKLSYRLDGDDMRHGLNNDLGFSKEDRDENIRRIIEVASLFRQTGVITLASFISPYKAMRQLARQKIGEPYFIEIYVKAQLDTCIKRDPKGLYKKALEGNIKDFTGISAPYEQPLEPNIIIDTDVLSLEQSVEKILGYLEEHHFLDSEIV